MARRKEDWSPVVGFSTVNGKIDPVREAIADCILGKSDKIEVIVSFRGHSDIEKKMGKHCKNLFCMDTEILTKDFHLEGGPNSNKPADWDGERTLIWANGLYYHKKMKDWWCGECWMGESGICYDCDDRGETIIGIPSFFYFVSPAHRSWQIEEQERALARFVPTELDDDDYCDDDDDYCDECGEEWDDCECDDDDDEVEFGEDDIDEDTGIHYTTIVNEDGTTSSFRDFFN